MAHGPLTTPDRSGVRTTQFRLYILWCVSIVLWGLLLATIGIWLGGCGVVVDARGHAHVPPPFDRMEIVVDDTIGPDLPNEKKGMKPEDHESYFGASFTLFRW